MKKTFCERTEILEGFAVVVVDRGFVYVGEVRHDGEWCIITNARNVRVWGTTKGLGELATNGPTPKTMLDPCGTVRVPGHALVTLIDTEESLWRS